MLKLTKNLEDDLIQVIQTGFLFQDIKLGQLIKNLLAFAGLCYLGMELQIFFTGRIYLSKSDKTVKSTKDILLAKKQEAKISKQ